MPSLHSANSELPRIVTGRSNVHINALHQPPIHVELVGPFEDMARAALKEGFAIRIASGYRSFDAQLAIWNAKVEGTRSVLDAASKPVDVKTLQPRQLIHTILRWSALPGASRHHWGSDIDVFDAAFVPADYKVQLVPSEYEGTGPFTGMSEWLDENMETYGFFRPYETERGGVSPERWHLSYRPIADVYLEALTVDVLREAIESADLKIKEAVLQELPLLFDKFVTNVD